MNSFWQTDETQMLALSIDGVYYGKWKRKWAGRIQDQLAALLSYEGLKEQIARWEEELGWKEALNMLSRKACFSSEIRKRLETAGCSPAAVESVLAKCRRAGYVNDEERSHRMVEIWAKKGYGPMRIRLELKKNAVAIPRSLDHPAHNVYLSRYIGKHLPPKATRVQKAKVIRALLRRGFSLEAIYEVCKNVASDL
jgi:regulatory protein